MEAGQPEFLGPKTEGGLKPPLHYRQDASQVWVVGGVQAVKAEALLPHSKGRFDVVEPGDS